MPQSAIFAWPPFMPFTIIFPRVPSGFLVWLMNFLYKPMVLLLHFPKDAHVLETLFGNAAFAGAFVITVASGASAAR